MERKRERGTGRDGKRDGESPEDSHFYSPFLDYKVT